jgi:hypothetical protein
MTKHLQLVGAKKKRASIVTLTSKGGPSSAFMVALPGGSVEYFDEHGHMLLVLPDVTISLDDDLGPFATWSDFEELAGIKLVWFADICPACDRPAVFTMPETGEACNDCRKDPQQSTAVN